MAKAGPDWTSVADLVDVLTKRWQRGTFLRAYAAGELWEPISLPIRGPRAAELLDRLAEATTWVQKFERDCGRRLRIEHKTIKGRALGSNEIPGRAWIDTFEQLVAFLGVATEVADLDDVRAQTKINTGQTKINNELSGWVAAHPQQAIAHRAVWGELLATVGWIVDHPPPRSLSLSKGLYLRHVDVPGVDTKFIENYRLILAELLEQVLAEDRIDARYGRSDFAGRFRFRRRPDYTRLRFGSDTTMLPAGLTEVSLRTEELATLNPPVSQVFIIENEISYLAFPDVDDAIVVFGSGFALTTLKALLWLDELEIIYWGDIDTYGFAILNQLRARFGHVRSMLMDHDTLLAHPKQWVIEPIPTNLPQPNLTDAESELYDDLVTDRYGHHVRLEQERVRFSRVNRAIDTIN